MKIFGILNDEAVGMDCQFKMDFSIVKYVSDICTANILVKLVDSESTTPDGASLN